MSSRRTVAIVNKSSGGAPIGNSRLKPASAAVVVAKNPIRIGSMRAANRNDRNEASSKAAAPSTVGLTSSVGRESGNISSSNNMKNSKAAAAAVSSKPIWQSVKQLGSRVSAKAKSAAGNINHHQQHNQLTIKQAAASGNKEEDMVTSTETESSGVFSDSSEGKVVVKVSSSNNTRPTSRVTSSASSNRSTNNRITNKQAPASSTTASNGECSLYIMHHPFLLSHDFRYLFKKCVT